MNARNVAATLAVLLVSVVLLSGLSEQRPFWSQWGRNSQHTGMVNIPAQPLNLKLADIAYDDFVE